MELNAAIPQLGKAERADSAEDYASQRLRRR
jgi:hypothetical protein